MSSPFARAKFEESTKHIYFLPRDLTAQLENARPTVLFGSRGSGKTTLLRAMDWQDRVENETLRQQLGGNPFRGRFVGVYTKLSDHSCKSLDFLHAPGTPLEGLIFGFYLDLLSIELISDAISLLISNGLLASRASAMEREVADEFSNKWEDLLTWAESSTCHTLRDISRATSRTRQLIERCSQQQIGPAALAARIRIPAFGEFSKSISSAFEKICSLTYEGNDHSDLDWHFKICLDEAEVLSERQRLVVNSLVRVACAPLFPVVSYVSRPTDLSQTLFSGLTLQKADFQQISLDEQSAAVFRELAEGVATIRCRQELEDADVNFSAADSLGKLSLNQLLDGLIQKSENPAAQELQNSTKEFAREWAPEFDEEKFPPYIQAFLAESLDLTQPKSEEFKGKRRLESEQFRKKMVVAYLAICRKLARNVRYAFAEMVLEISDGCIRDFLSQIHHIFIEKYPDQSSDDLREFLNNAVEPKFQEVAIRRASEQKRDSIPRSGVLRPVQVGRLVRGLSQLTALLQSRVPSEIQDGLIERGNFYLRGGTSDQRREASRLVRDAIEAGFLRQTGNDDQSDPLGGFRVHTSLSPAFGFSYRGAYYPMAIDAEAFYTMLDCNDDATLDGIAKMLADDRPLKPDPQLLLFGDEDRAEGDKE